MAKAYAIGLLKINDPEAMGPYLESVEKTNCTIIMNSNFLHSISKY